MRHHVVSLLLPPIAGAWERLVASTSKLLIAKKDLNLAEPVAISDELPQKAVCYSWLLARSCASDAEHIRVQNVDMNVFVVCFLVPFMDFLAKFGKPDHTTESYKSMSPYFDKAAAEFEIVQKAAKPSEHMSRMANRFKEGHAMLTYAQKH